MIPATKTLAITLIISASFTLMNACTWVKIPLEAEQVVLLPADRVNQCRRVGQINSSVRANLIGSIARNADKVRNELDNLARQQALQMGANTIVRQSIINGKGTYIAYGCP